MHLWRYTLPSVSWSLTDIYGPCYRYKIGDCFVSLPQPEVLEMLQASQERIDDEVSTLRVTLDGIHEQMEELKKALYGRFGRSINLET